MIWNGFLKILQWILSEFTQWTFSQIPWVTFALSGLGLATSYFQIWLGLLIFIISIFIFFYSKSKKTQYVSLQEAAQILSKFVEDTPGELVEYITPINPPDLIGEFIWRKDHPDKTHKETLPKITIGLINLALHLCKKNNVKVYGKRPSSSNYMDIPFEKIQFFSTDYTMCYSDMSREPSTLIYQDISIIKKDFEYAINNVDKEQLGKILNETIYGTKTY